MRAHGGPPFVCCSSEMTVGGLMSPLERSRSAERVTLHAHRYMGTKAPNANGGPGRHSGAASATGMELAGALFEATLGGVLVARDGLVTLGVGHRDAPVVRGADVSRSVEDDVVADLAQVLVRRGSAAEEVAARGAIDREGRVVGVVDVVGRDL